MKRFGESWWSLPILTAVLVMAGAYQDGYAQEHTMVSDVGVEAPVEGAKRKEKPLPMPAERLFGTEDSSEPMSMLQDREARADLLFEGSEIRVRPLPVELQAK